MKKLTLTRFTLKMVVVAFVGGCGTFFPAKPAERAADKILDEVFQDKPPPAPASGEMDPKKP
jgi:hypothetical protein